VEELTSVVKIFNSISVSVGNTSTAVTKDKYPLGNKIPLLRHMDVEH
jgi:hypothetical protein